MIAEFGYELLVHRTNEFPFKIFRAMRKFRLLLPATELKTQVIPVILESCSAGSFLNYLALIHPPCWVKALPCLFGGLQGPISSLAVAVGFTFLAMKYGSGDGVDSKRTPGWNAGVSFLYVVMAPLKPMKLGFDENE
ncbi:hypothetical protein NC652_000199 [Populus alba x Populus x berolinensis]|nr:hypothetical protein NC652_000199 [Populus alba x Populus x berolinensis]